MLHVHIYLDDSEVKELLKVKGKKSWKEVLMMSTHNDSPRKRPAARRKPRDSEAGSGRLSPQPDQADAARAGDLQVEGGGRRW